MKAYFKYDKTERFKAQGEKNIENAICGKLFKAKYIDHSVEFLPTDAMKEGIYFEYLCTGALPRNNEIPQPEVNTKGELTPAYKRIKEASNLFKKVISHYKIKIDSIGLVLEDENKNGIIDILAEWNGEKCIIDLKYSGLLDDKWNNLGWNTETLSTKDDLMIQGVHYKILAEDILGIKDIPFYYFVFNSKNPTDMKIIKQIVQDDRKYLHRTDIDKIKNELEQLMYHPKAFQPYPDYRQCKDCPLFSTCEQRAEVPLITEVYY